MKKKLVSVLLCAAMVSSMLYGCGSKTEEAPAADAATEETAEAEAPAEEAAAEVTTEAEDAEINMFISSPEYADAINQLIAEYQKENPNITINYETTQNDYPTLLKAKLNAGECPDIFSSTSGKEIQTYLEYSYNIGSEPISESMSDAVKATMKSGEEVHGFAIKGNYFGVVYNKAI
ncbi:MAG: extracellular solute-binding protein, partial [Lachnospiraceae bacterium]|nr:extracellular solute-binding protein [Lachnospiraceae bacterium]